MVLAFKGPTVAGDRVLQSHSAESIMHREQVLGALAAKEVAVSEVRGR